ncbi:nephrocystin-1 isoform X2 [Brachyhypopomus gauderio]|uniref:nephrocystin-1 isoform X2 n=1 Tax=Brachyhypopomus gauderio TaxID=698409 RepID=UPI004041B9FA
MPQKKKGALQTVQRDTDDIRRRVDVLTQDVSGLDVEERTETTQRCLDLQNTVTETLKKLQQLTKADESTPIGNYEQRKHDELERLRTLQDRLRALRLQLQPQDKGVGPSSDGEQESMGEEEEESQEDEEDEDCEEEDDDDAAVDLVAGDAGRGRGPAEETPPSYVALGAFTGDEEGDLTVQKGDVLTVLQKNEDGWWFAQDPKGNRGLVPQNYLQMISPHEQDKQSEDEESDEEEYARNDPSDVQPGTSSNWGSSQKAVAEMDATDVLSAMGAIPPGFRASTLSRLLEEGTSYKASHYIQPKLSQSELCFKDLHLDPNTGKVHVYSSLVCLTLTLWSCRLIPPPGVGLQVLSRHVRLCAFNGTQVLSNIHTVRATHSPKTWSFSPRVQLVHTQSQDTFENTCSQIYVSGVLPSLLDGDCFFRCDSDSPGLGILFELGITYIRNSTGEKGDLSCGWAFLRLFDDNGTLIPPRTHELTLHGGTPYEREANIDATSNKRGTNTGVLQQMLMSRKQPKLVVKLKSPNTRTREQLNLLPDTMVGCLSTLPLITLYRQLLADTLLLDRVTMQNADLICSPVLATFPKVLDQPDLMDAFKSWVETLNSLKRSDKKDIRVLKESFESVFLSSVFPLLFLAEMPAPLWAHEDTETQRARLIYNPTQKITMETMTSSNHTHQAFNVSQVTYDLLDSAWR